MNLFREALISIANKLLVLLFGWLIVPLIAQGWIAADIGLQIQDSLQSWAGILVGTIVLFLYPIAQGLWNKVVAKAKILIALSLPETSTPARVDRDAAHLNLTQTVAVATGDLKP